MAETIARHIVTMPPVALRMMKEFVVRFGDLPTGQAWHVQNLLWLDTTYVVITPNPAGLGSDKCLFSRTTVTSAFAS